MENEEMTRESPKDEVWDDIAERIEHIDSDARKFEDRVGQDWE